MIYFVESTFTDVGLTSMTVIMLSNIHVALPHLATSDAMIAHTVSRIHRRMYVHFSVRRFEHVSPDQVGRASDDHDHEPLPAGLRRNRLRQQSK